MSIPLWSKVVVLIQVPLFWIRGRATGTIPALGLLAAVSLVDRALVELESCAAQELALVRQEPNEQWMARLKRRAGV